MPIPDHLKVSVILPTLNEADNIVPLIRRIYEIIPNLHEIVVVDDDSPDGTARLVEEYAAATPGRRIRVERRLIDHGLTRSLQHGIDHATGDVIVWMDCDFSMPPEEIPRLLHSIEEGYDIAVGSRFVRGGRFKQNTEGTPDSAVAVFLSRAMNYSIQFLLDHSFKDYTSGFVAARRPTLDAIPLSGNYGEYFIDYIFRAIRAGYRIIELPYVCLPRRQGVSKTGQSLPQYLKLGKRYVWTAIRLRWLAFAGRLPQKRVATPGAPEPGRLDGDAIAIQPMTEDVIPFVAGLHHRVLYNTLNSRLGIPFLEDLYGAIAADPRSRGWVALSGRRMAGFITCTTDLHATDRHVMRRLAWRDRIIAALHILANWRDLRDYLAHWRLTRYVRRFGRPYATVLTLGVAPSIAGKGVGRRLMEQAEAFFRESGFQRYYVDTLAGNEPALAFYERMGFRQVGKTAGNVVLRRDIENYQRGF